MPLKNVYTIAPYRPFAEDLAQHLLDNTKDTLELADTTILLPTKRACKTMQETFLKLAKGKALILPELVPLGGIDEDSLALNENEQLTKDILPAISPMRRIFLLSKLILAKETKENIEKPSPEQAVYLAEALARLLDQTQLHGLSFEHLENLVPEEYAEHWQETLEFLKIITAFWPDILKEEQKLDNIERQIKLLKAQAMDWQENPPEKRIIAAGSTGSLPTTAELLNVVASLPNGCVILPGLDRNIDSKSWENIEESHPQYGMKKLLERFEIDRKDVKEWAYSDKDSDRFKLASEIMRPASVSDKWKEITAFSEQALDGVTRLDCANLREEATAIALVMRQTLETENRTAALVTPDRNLARRVASELERWNIKIEDSAGLPLSKTQTGIFLGLVINMATERFAPVALLSVLKHPFSACGYDVVSFKEIISKLEKFFLRGTKPTEGLSGLKKVIRNKNNIDNQEVLEWLDNFSANAAVFENIMQQEKVDFDELLNAHIRLAETIATTDTEKGENILWKGDEGNSAADFIMELKESSEVVDYLDSSSYAGFFQSLMALETTHIQHSTHPRLSVLGPLEARLQRPDVLVLGSLNEGTWPADNAIDPWLSRYMKEKFGLPLPEQKTGLSAHDFAQGFCAKRVFLTRAKKIDGTPTVPSRWLLRLDAVMEAGKIDKDKLIDFNQDKWLSWAQKIDMTESFENIEPPAPVPPVYARPKRLSVTRIETLMRDPYEIYAQYVLNLKALEPLEADPAPADYGNIVHKILEEFSIKFPKQIPENANELLYLEGDREFLKENLPEGIIAFWKPRYRRVVDWFVEQEKNRRYKIEKSWQETGGTMLIDTPDRAFEVYAKADRIDLLKDGTIGIIDYKTGKPPSQKAIEAGYSPQLPLEALIAEKGGFTGIKEGKVSEMLFWRLNGDNVGGYEQSACKNIDALLDKTYEGIRNLAAVFEREETPYTASPYPNRISQYSDYLYLERVKEWVEGQGESK